MSLIKIKPESVEVVAARVRVERNKLLSDSDWTQGKDIPDSVSSQYAIYRQALRDLPEQAGFPFEVVYPINPT